jgi:sugar phosphate isomerase/epimerase
MNDHAKVRVGIQPTGWTDDDFPEIGDHTPYQQTLDETRAAGFDGGSTGHNYPSHLPSLLASLRTRGLRIVSTWLGTRFTARNEYRSTLDNMQAQMAFLQAVDATDVVVAELAGAAHQTHGIATRDLTHDKIAVASLTKKLACRIDARSSVEVGLLHDVLLRSSTCHRGLHTTRQPLSIPLRLFQDTTPA